ncbi:ATP-binding protein [Salidesulfovibrio onnuriiensis]|uniref:ATP-binding protein n=1 Tax=Salidesulfovibrio onnuriiensis TaxID=2583823 RepID=UPI0011CCC2AF|nr:ATP-binding protein [Salidesulfovibrio onnuriiensis]
MEPHQQENDITHEESRRRPALIPTLSMYAIIAVVLLCGLALIVGNSLTTINTLATDTRDTLLPSIVERQRTAVNLERLGRFGLTVYMTGDPSMRRQATLTARILSQDAVFESNPVISHKVQEAFKDIGHIARLRSEQEDIARQMETYNAELNTLRSKGRTMLDGGKAPLCQAWHRMMRTLESLDSLKNTEELARAMQDYDAAAGELRTAEPGMADILAELPALKLFTAKRKQLALDSRCTVLWDKVHRSLDETAASLSAAAAMTASNRFTIISEEAESGMSSGIVAMLVFMGTLVIMLFIIHKDVLVPIVNSVRAMVKTQNDRKPMELPKARLREMYDIQASMERSARLMSQIGERTEELERVNAALETEIAERRRTEAELETARAAAEAADKAKSEFLAGMSHEIRTPMNTIMGMAEMMMETDPTPEQRRFIEIFRSSGEHLLGLINDVLDLSKIEAGQLRLEETSISLAETLNGIAALYAAKAQKKKLLLEVVISPKLPGHILGDPIRLGQVLTNLLDNAIKFTHQGSVTLTAEPGPSGIAGEITFSVRDTGIGIPPAVQQKIFDRFTQVDSSTTREYGGTGLGLAICRRLVTTMGGDLILESVPDQGSTFRFTLHFRLPQPSGKKAALQRTVEVKQLTELLNLKTVNILLAEDSESNRELLQFYLAKTACQVDFADHGEAALEKFRENDYDIVLMDIQMPIMDGFEATRRIREYEKENNLPPTPVIAVTANALSEDRGRCIAAGCTFYLSKPITKVDLLKTIASAVGLV